MEQEAILARPGRIKAFGIMHMIFGVLTTLLTIVGLAIKPLMMGMYRSMAENAATEAERLQAEMQLKFQEGMSLYNTLTSGMMLVLAVILIVAGLLLLKSKRSGQSLSITWGWLALLGTVIWLVMAFVMVMPKMPEMMGSAMEQGMADSGASLSEAEKEEIKQKAGSVTTVMMGVGFVLFGLLAAIYPILTLVLLKKKAVGEWLAQYGS